jgi:hypothetical protein
MQVVTQILEGEAHSEFGMYYNEDKGFVKVTQCKDCKLTGYHLDLSNYNPCPNCGGDIRELSAPGRMKDGKWEIRTAFHKVDKTPDFYRKEGKTKLPEHTEPPTNAGFFAGFL